MNLKSKVVLAAAVLASVGLICSIGFIAYRAKTVVGEQAESIAQLTASAEARRIQGVFAARYASVYGLARLVSATLADHKPLSRDQINNIMASTLKDTPDVLAFSLGLESNVLDNKDSSFVNTEAHDATGRFLPYWFRENGVIKHEALNGYDKVGENDWYIIPQKTLQDAPVEPYKYAVGGKEVLMTSLMTPIIVGGKFHGVAGTDIDLSILKEELSRLRPFGEGRVRLISASGRYISHENAAAIGQPVNDMAADFLSQIKAGKSVRNIVATPAGDSFRYVEPFAIGKDGAFWALEVEIPVKLAVLPATQMAWIAALIAAATLILLVVALTFLISHIMLPLRYLQNSVMALSEGKADLRTRLPVGGNDEIGHIAEAYNRFIERIQNLIREIQSQVHDLRDTTARLTHNSQQIADRSETQSGAAGSVASAVEEITVSIASVSDAAREIRDIAESANSHASEAEARIRTSAENAQQIDQTTQALGKRVASLQNYSLEIGNIVQVITDLAGQTNLLALNAAIEAARAGEQGRGFAVVADEVRKLAERTTSSTQIIGRTIDSVQQGIALAVDEVAGVSEQVRQSTTLTTQAVSSIQTISHISQQLSQQFTDIASSLAEQTAASSDIAKHVENISSMSSDNNDAVQDGNKVIDQLSSQAEILERKIREFTV